MAVKMNLRIITKRFAADPEIGFLTKSISKANGYATAMPPAWELKINNFMNLTLKLKIFLFNFKKIFSTGDRLNSFSLSILEIFDGFSSSY